MKLKVCGIRTVKALQHAISAQVDFIGLNFVPSSKRFIKQGDIRPASLLRNLGSKYGGVFRKEAEWDDARYLEWITECTTRWELDIIQLHGQESPEFCSSVAKSCQKPVWKAFCLNNDFDPAVLQQYCKIIDLALFDAKTPGEGSVIELELLEPAISAAEKEGIPYGIAGGITPQNIQEFEKRFPGVEVFDVASGVETDGGFDPDKCRKLQEEIQR